MTHSNDEDFPRTDAEAFDAFANAALLRLNETGNPIYAWDVIARATKGDGTYLQLPDWCRWYLSDVAIAMMEHANRHSKASNSTASALSDILFMSRAGWNPFKDYKADQRRQKIALAKVLLQASRATPSEVDASLTELSGVHSPRARRRLVAEGETGAKRKRQHRQSADQT
jgi:hypothetical protein